MMTRRKMLISSGALLFGAPLVSVLDQAWGGTGAQGPLRYKPVIAANGASLPWKIVNGVKEFQLVAEPVRQEIAPGMVINAWGYNGRTPGPVIEAVEGDRVRILVTNKLPEHHAVHWHGVLLPNGMDGVGGLTQKQIAPGETYAYEFTLHQHGTQMYHAHADEVVQMAMGMMGFFVIHPRGPKRATVDRDFCIFLHEWFVEPGTETPNPNVMTDFNLFTFNGRAFPGTDPLVVRLGQRVRIRIANVSMDSHPIHLHGHYFKVTATDGGPIPLSAQWPETTVNVPPGTTRDIEFVADNPGDWALHCHKSHHTMNPMSHEIPNLIGVSPEGVERDVQKLIPDYMAMGHNGMADMSAMAMPIPRNTLPMMTGQGPFGPVEMGGMFTVVKIRKGIKGYEDPGWYKHPSGTVAQPAGGTNE